MAHRLLQYNGPVINSDLNNTVGTIVERDPATGAINVGDLNAGNVIPSIAYYLTSTAAQTGTAVSIDATKSVVRLDATAGNQIATLPPVASCAGLLLCVKRVDASGNTCTLKGSGSENIDATNTLSIATRGHTWVYNNGTTWDIVA